MGVYFGKEVGWVDGDGMAQVICARSNMGGRGGADGQRGTLSSQSSRRAPLCLVGFDKVF